MRNSVLVTVLFRRLLRSTFMAALIVMTWLAGPARGQQTQPTQPPPINRPPDALLEAAAEQADRTAPPAQLVFHNRFITEFRAGVLSRPPEDRAAAARQALERFVREGASGQVSVRAGENFRVFSVGGRDLFALFSADVDELAGVTLTQQAAETASRLETALAEARELRTPTRLLVSGAEALAVTILFGLLIWGLLRLRRSIGGRIGEGARRRLEASGVADREFLQSSRVLDLLQTLVTIGVVAIGFVLTYHWLTFVLRRFPYSRPWGDSLRGFLFDQLAFIGRAIVNAAPQLFTVLWIFVLTRFVAKLTNLFFSAVEQGRISIGWIYPETLQPTRKLVLAGIWLFALALAFPFLPGSESEAFKGISVLLGLMVTLGSSGLVNQVMEWVYVDVFSRPAGWRFRQGERH
jgi:hypothetical protein